MKNVVKHIQNMNAIHRMWSDFDTLIIGVSGGPDSMCLLHAMIEIARKERLTIVVAHVNYGLRGDDSDDDQSIVELAARDNALPCEVFIVQDHEENNENYWRSVRYDFFERMRKKYDASGIVVAHNLNDQAETFLLHLLRGSSLSGLACMQFVSRNHVVRPLLSVPRDVIMSYCDIHDVPYRMDKTNEEVTHTRNKIRMELIPYLQEHYNPQIITTLMRTAEMIADDLDYMSEQIEVFWLLDVNTRSLTFSAQQFCSMSVSVQRKSIMIMLEQIFGTTKDVEKGMVDEVRKMIASTKNKHQIFSCKNLKILKKSDTVKFTCHISQSM
jgi:tRNA(Ile)-lysidine synthase